VPLKRNADTALKQCPEVRDRDRRQRTGGAIELGRRARSLVHELCAAASPDCPPEEMAAEDPLFISTPPARPGSRRAVLHTTGGYLVYTAMTHEYVFDYRDGEISGAPPMSAGSPATATSSRAARQRARRR